MAITLGSKGSGPSRFALICYSILLTTIIHIVYTNHYGPVPIPTMRFASSHNLSSLTPQPPKPFPRKIWQTSKVSAAGLDETDRAAIHSWTTMNQKYRYEILTQYSAESYVRETFAHRPDIEEVFRDLQDPILRADLIRYLVLLGDGGVYSDIDTRSLRPIDDWIPSAYSRYANVVIGVEYDALDGPRWGDWTLDLQFCTWAIMARPGHELLELTVDRVLRKLKNLALKQGTAVAGIKANFDEVLDTTGPASFTLSVFELLSRNTGTNFSWLNVTGMTQPRLVGDVLLLPITAFGSGQQHSASGSPDDDEALVQHLFKGSWKNSHPLDAVAVEASAPAPAVDSYRQPTYEEEQATIQAAVEAMARQQAEQAAVAAALGAAPAAS
ncbi:hypothetical protein MMC25_001339 [Agyrium rufum]|nr:hypothetical protein [Agyrium rufum]